MLINWILHFKSESDLFLYTRNLKLVWNGCIKAFWYTTDFIKLKKLKMSLQEDKIKSLTTNANAQLFVIYHKENIACHMLSKLKYI